ncbi:hypothetical protein FAZ19_04050 [Sphingobacterium alkalisoli]|uniref:Uncharacterized protein n=1 Tax=Sphingobacterium alkalisoli TaxID=1874115 RepID=A0A4U0HAL2_9SPHI|nr:hypothetical protein [Sphingobacterium alkalisoli]TJY68434.1 hypothetical protein FAZ19_04050 [Sphingobacterium alkalisoli]GGH06505.1 hypothetical protein GCM10011418_03250 [Sphingobacterium alkalisoli]
MHNEEKQSSKQNETVAAALRRKLDAVYSAIRDWMSPSKDQHTVVQILIFILKLPVLLLILAVSPVFILLMGIVVLIAL